MRTSILSISIIISSVLGARTSWQVGDVVQTTSGPVKGHASEQIPAVSEYLGIPYGQAPVGQLRWAKPVPYKGNTTINADKWGADCLFNLPSGPPFTAPTDGSTQKVPAGLMSLAGHNASEDCLFVNVWSKPQTGEKSKAVLLWIHGGGFNLGASNSPDTVGTFLADQEDVVVVSFNYRMNIFGFPGTPGLPAQNLGIYDIRAGVEWAYNNIAAFGGDPKRITIFGESGGAGAVDYYSYAWVDEPNPMVNGFIAESGSVFMTGIKAADRSGFWWKVSEKLGCGGKEAGAEKTLECAKGKDAKALLEAIKRPGSGKSTLDSQGAVVDEKVIFGDYKARAKAGKFIKKPILVGNNNNEAGLMSFLQAADTPSDPAESKKVNNLLFTCQSQKVASFRRAQNVPVWRYQYSGDWPNTAIGAPGMGAFHGAEIPLVFGSAAVISGKANTATEDKVMKDIMHAWAEFAKDPEKGLSKLGWPVYDETKNTVVEIALNNSATISFSSPAVADKECSLTDRLPI